MATDEEYLDSLLKSLTENEQQPRTMQDVMKEIKVEPSEEKEDFPMSSDELADMLDNLEGLTDSNGTTDEIPVISDIPEEEPVISDIPEEEPVISDILEEEPVISDILEEEPVISDIPEEESVISDMPENITGELSNDSSDEDLPEDMSWKDDFEKLLSLDNENQKAADNFETEISDSEKNHIDDDTDVTQLIDNMDNTDDDLAEINGLLKKVDKNESVEDDMLALLEGVKESHDDENIGEQDSFDIFSQNQENEQDENAEQISELLPKKEKKKKEKRGLFGKRKKEKQEQLEQNNESDVIEQLEQNTDEIDLSQVAVKTKKAGFFAKLFETLTKEDDNPESLLDENEAIMKELDEEDSKKAKKKNKKEKKNKKGKQEENTENAEEKDEESEEENTKDKKKKQKVKKEKKEKKEKPPKEKIVEKKVLSRKNMIAMFASCVTIVACIFALSTFLPDYADKKTAREAFYQNDYDTVYKLLYDKRLTQSDTLIFNGAKDVLTLERKLVSYKSNIGMVREVEAIDALLQGVACYNKLENVDICGVRDQVDSIYEEICNILIEEYQISPEEALEINSYDNILYTMKLNSLVYGTEFFIPGEEPEEPLPPQDVLPEEEDIITY